MVGRHDLPAALRAGRQALARAEAEHFIALMENEPIGVQIGIVQDTLPHTSFQIFRQPDGRSWRSARSGSARSRTSASAWR